MWSHLFSDSTRICLVGGIEGATCISEGAKSKQMLKMADFCHFSGGGASDGGGGNLGTTTALIPLISLPQGVKTTCSLLTGYVGLI